MERRHDKAKTSRPIRDIEAASGKIDSDSLCTPPSIIEPLKELFDGEIDCDPCSNEHSLVGALTTYTWGGLARPWGGAGVGRGKRRAYSNWPYSTNDPWASKAVYEMKIGNVHELAVLCMAVPSTVWWRNLMIEPKRNPRVLMTKRLKFYGPNGKPLKDSARFDTALIYYGRKEAKFDRLFQAITMWSTRGR